LRVLLAFNDYDDIVLNMVGTLPKDGKVDSFALTPHCNWELNGNLVPPISKFKNQTAVYALSDVFFNDVSVSRLLWSLLLVVVLLVIVLLAVVQVLVGAGRGADRRPSAGEPSTHPA
jgi:hypothetical protein